MEIERKFLLKSDKWQKEVKSSHIIIQGYICSVPEHTVRVRVIGDKAFLTVKGKNKGISRTEIETPIDLNAAYNLLDNFCSETIISKKRHIVEYKNHIWEIDEFFGRHLGLIVAEVELKSENESLDLPDWAGEEVSDKKEYFNSNLANYKKTDRILQRLNALSDNLDKCNFLYDIFHADFNAFYETVMPRKEEFLPIIYTPTVGDAVIHYSEREIKSPRLRGITININQANEIKSLLLPYKDKIDIAVVTDGEGVLGIGDQGANAINIVIGKLMVYTICGKINPERTLPIMLDVGTNNETLLNSPVYKGLKQPRASKEQYDIFIDAFVNAFKSVFPQSLLHWEDFGKNNALRVLNKYKTILPSFNDDIQGTGTVALAAVLTAIEKTGIPAEKHKICVFGAGTAGCGITNHICKSLAYLEKTTFDQLKKRFYLIDKEGLLIENMDLPDFQAIYARTNDEISTWKVKNKNSISLLETIKNAKPTILIGCSTVCGAFTEEIIKTMYSYCKNPVIMPLSNPISNAEAIPDMIYKLTDGNALVATGSPFPPVMIDGKEIYVSQCNNSLGFPGIGLAMIAGKIPVLSDAMLIAASLALKNEAKKEKFPYSLLPGFKNVEQISVKIAKAIIAQANKDGSIKMSEKEATLAIKNKLWHCLHKDNK